MLLVVHNYLKHGREVNKIYQKFKRWLLDETEMRRDMIVLKASEPLIEPLFEVSSFDDKLHKCIPGEFDKIAVSHAGNLLCDLCWKYKIYVEIIANITFWKGD